MECKKFFSRMEFKKCLFKVRDYVPFTVVKVTISNGMLQKFQIIYDLVNQCDILCDSYWKVDLILNILLETNKILVNVSF